MFKQFRKSQFWWNEEAVFDFGQEMVNIELNFLSNFWEHLQEFLLPSILHAIHLNIAAFWPKANASFHFSKIGSCYTTWTLFKYCKMS
jgi:hypothetical protein